MINFKTREQIYMDNPFRYVAIAFLFFLIQLTSQPALACVEGLSWGMKLPNIEEHLGVPLASVKTENTSNFYEVKNFKMSGIPVNSIRVRLEDQDGLQQLAYEMDHEHMTEVLAGLRHRFGTPVGTSLDIDGGSPQQQWIWHTGEDVITAVKSEQRPFLLSYRLSLLDPSFL